MVPTDFQPSAQTWIGASALLILGVWSSALIPRMWRSPDLVGKIRASASFLGERLGNAAAAVAPLGAAFVLVTAALLFAALIESSLERGVPLLAGVRVVLTVLVLIATLLTFSITLLGRPRRLIPPAVRGFRGVLRSQLRS
jgi:hypothetical protein